MLCVLCVVCSVLCEPFSLRVVCGQQRSRGAVLEVGVPTPKLPARLLCSAISNLCQHVFVLLVCRTCYSCLIFANQLAHNVSLENIDRGLHSRITSLWLEVL